MNTMGARIEGHSRDMIEGLRSGCFTPTGSRLCVEQLTKKLDDKINDLLPEEEIEAIIKINEMEYQLLGDRAAVVYGFRKYILELKRGSYSSSVAESIIDEIKQSINEGLVDLDRLDITLEELDELVKLSK